jgi:hypothetical protein
MTKVINPHLTLPLTSPMIGASRIELHEKFVVWYRDENRQSLACGWKNTGGFVFDLTSLLGL